ncbi:MAG: FapA family protein [Acidobacteriota bacterium]
MTQTELTSKLKTEGTRYVLEGSITGCADTLRVTGSLEVRGDIESGVTLMVEGDLTVKGSVFEAAITATGNVRIEEAFIGSGKGRVDAGGDVMLSVINGQSVSAKGSISIRVEAIKAEIVAYNKIDAPFARIVGGRIEAGNEMTVKTLGSEEGQSTKVYLGNRKKLIQRLTDISQEEKQLAERLPQINEGIYKLNRLKVDGVALTPEQESAANRLRALRDSYPRQMELFRKEIERVNQLLKEKTNATLSVLEGIFENVMVDINGFKEVTESPLRSLRYKMGATGLLKEPL